jgi:hypothetical protein
MTEDDSDISSSEEEEDLHFQVDNGFDDAFTFAQLGKGLEPLRKCKGFHLRIEKLFKQTHGTKSKLELREIILLDNQSTTDLICNPSLVGKTFKSSRNLRLQSNGGTMSVTHKARMPGYHAPVWYDKKAITNILSMHNVIKQYRVTYDSDELMFVVHRGSENKPSMEFRMHESGLHYYDPRDEQDFVFVSMCDEDAMTQSEDVAFVNTVSSNKEGFSKRQIKAAEVARTLYATLSYPSAKDYRWAIQSNQIKDCPVTVQDIDVALKL